MTDKIIIDGVDVNGCEFAESDILDNKIQIICKYCKNRGEFIYGCGNNPNCYYKQLARKTEECELKTVQYEQEKFRSMEFSLTVDKLQKQNEFLIKEFNRVDKQRDKWREKAEQYKQALEEIKEIANKSNTVSCLNVDNDCSNCTDKLTNYGNNCMERGLKQILQKCEVINDISK